jgi:hypothetical protein
VRAWGVGAFTWRLRGRQVSMGTMMTPPPTPTRLPNVPAMPPAVFACACAYMHPLVRERAAAHLSFALWLALFLSPARALDFSFARIVSRPLLIICLLSPCVRAPARAGAQKCVSGAKIPTGRPSAAERPLAPPPLPAPSVRRSCSIRCCVACFAICRGAEAPSHSAQVCCIQLAALPSCPQPSRQLHVHQRSQRRRCAVEHVSCSYCTVPHAHALPAAFDRGKCAGRRAQCLPAQCSNEERVSARGMKGNVALTRTRGLASMLRRYCVIGGPRLARWEQEVLHCGLDPRHPSVDPQRGPYADLFCRQNETPK